jgi:hypothetical protein
MGVTKKCSICDRNFLNGYVISIEKVGNNPDVNEANLCPTCAPVGAHFFMLEIERQLARIKSNA